MRFSRPFSGKFHLRLPVYQVQNLAMRGVSSPKGVGVKTEAPERSDSGKDEVSFMSFMCICYFLRKCN